MTYNKSIEIDGDYIQPTANPPSAKLGMFIIGEQYTIEELKI